MTAVIVPPPCRSAERAAGAVDDRLPVEPLGHTKLARLDDGPIGPVQQLLRADHVFEHPHRRRAVGGGLVEHQRVRQRRAGPAPRGQPLGVQRREPGEHREHHTQSWMTRAPGGQEREPCGLHAGDVAGQRRPPQRVFERRLADGARRVHAQPRSRVHEQRRLVSARAVLAPSAGRRSPRRSRARPRAATGRRSRARAPGRRRRGQHGRARSPPTRRTAPPATVRPRGRRRSARSACSRGSHSIPSGLDRHTSARSRPSSSTSAARCAGASLGRSITYGRSPARYSTVSPFSRRTNGSSLRAASASTSGSVQRCWCTSIFIRFPICFMENSTSLGSPRRGPQPCIGSCARPLYGARCGLHRPTSPDARGLVRPFVASRSSGPQ